MEQFFLKFQLLRLITKYLKLHCFTSQGEKYHESKMFYFNKMLTIIDFNNRKNIIMALTQSPNPGKINSNKKY